MLISGYINEGGTLNLSRFEKFMTALAAIEIDNFSEHYADLKYFQSKTGRRPNMKERTSVSFISFLSKSALKFFKKPYLLCALWQFDVLLNIFYKWTK